MPAGASSFASRRALEVGWQPQESWEASFRLTSGARAATLALVGLVVAAQQLARIRFSLVTTDDGYRTDYECSSTTSGLANSHELMTVVYSYTTSTTSTV